MKKFLFICTLSVLFLCNAREVAHAQTSGTLSFSVTTTEPAGNYNNVNVIALWIEDTNGNFVKTNIRYAASRIQYLNKWVSSSSYNVVDAVTGPTRTGHGTLTFNWNVTNVAGNLVADDYYRVYLQMSDANTAGQYTYVQFKKDTNAVTLNPADVGNFTNMVLTWTPSPASVIEREGATLNFDCTPNPAREMISISYQLETSADVTITLHDLSGRNIAVVADENQTAGPHMLNWNLAETPNLTAGVYYLRINTGKAVAVKKIVITK